MKKLSMKKAAAYLETVKIIEQIDTGHAIVVIGRNAAGARFVLVNDCMGKIVLSESF